MTTPDVAAIAGSLTFPVLLSYDDPHVRRGERLSVPWGLLEPHRAQALYNHCGQSLERLAQRGGLSWCEIAAVLEDREWRPMKEAEAKAAVDAAVRAYLMEHPNG